MAHELMARAVTKVYGRDGSLQEVLRGVSCRFERGHSYAITGVSGSGKSTLLHVLGGLDIPTSGSVLYDNVDVRTFVAHHRRLFFTQTVSFVFQAHYLLQEMTALENVALAGLIADQSPLEASKRAHELLEMLGLVHRSHGYPRELSGGEQQRVAIARALYHGPAFIFADEPTGSLDAGNAAQVTRILRESCRDLNVGLILCSHDAAVYEQLEVVLHLEEGKLMETAR